VDAPGDARSDVDPAAPATSPDDPSPHSDRWRLAPEEWACAATMALLCLITLANVVVRYLTNFSFAFTEEISVWLMVVMTLFGSAAAFTRGQHIAIAWFVERLPPSALAAVRRWGLLASVAMFAVLSVLGARMAWDDYAFAVTTPAMGLPQWLYTVWLPLLSLLVLARLLQAILRPARARR
jgi:TRAP-type C4-dicarboxylate transport system permease small subunit